MKNEPKVPVMDIEAFATAMDAGDPGRIAALDLAIGEAMGLDPELWSWDRLSWATQVEVEALLLRWAELGMPGFSLTGVADEIMSSFRAHFVENAEQWVAEALKKVCGYSFATASPDTQAALRSFAAFITAAGPRPPFVGLGFSLQEGGVL